MVALALAQAAWAEGGLPGGFATARQNAGTVPTVQAGAADAARAPEPGGVVLLPFADTAERRGQRIAPPGESTQGGNGYVVAAIAAAASLVVLTWVIARLL